MNGATKSKYRPVLTNLQIAHIITLAKEDIMSPVSRDYEVSISLLSSLSPFAAKIENAGIQPAYTEQPTNTDKLLESLGAEASDLLFDGRTKEQYWEECYERYTLFGSDNMSLTEIRAVREHMYLNSLMTPEQVTEFEKQLGYTS